MKTKLLMIAIFSLLAAGSAFGRSHFAIGIGVGPGYYPGYYYAPPPPVYSYAVPAPGPGYTWVDGYWYPVGPRYVWRRGYWARPPYYGAYWVGPRYYGHRYYRGYWR
jgi:hypothetical protein